MLSKIRETLGSRIGNVLLLLSSCFFVLTITAICLEDAIGEKIVEEIKTNIKSDLKVGDVSFSLISSFPYASLNLKNIVVQGNDHQNMLKAGSLRFKINVLSLFSAPVKIKAISIRDGVMLLKTDQNGNTNFDILKPTQEKNNDEVAFVLEKASLQNVIVGYQHAGKQEDAGFTIVNAIFKGAFSEKVFNLSSKADLVCHGISRAGKSFLVKKELSYKTNLKVDRLANSCEIGKFSLSIEDNKFDVQGKVAINKKATDLDLRFKATDCSIGSLLSIFPQARIKELSSEGDLTLSGSIKGVQSPVSKPAINAQIRLANGTLKSPKLTNALENVNFNAKLSYGSGESYLIMDDFRGNFGKQPVALRFSLKNLANPYLDLFLDGKIPLASTYQTFGMKNLQSATGFLALRQIHLSGMLEDMKQVSSIGQVNMTGALAAENISLVLNNDNISIPGGLLRFDNNNISAEGLQFVAAGSRCSITGSVSNLLPVILGDPLQKNAKLGFKLKLSADNIEAKKMASLFQDKSQKSASVKMPSQQNESTSGSFFSISSGVIEARVENFSYGKIKGRHFNSSFGFEQDNLLLNGSMETMQGKIALNGRLSLAATPSLRAVINGNNIDTRELFEECENFGQEIVRSKNISGQMNCQIAVDAFWDKNWNFIDNKLNVLAYLRINEGQLQGLKMMENFSTYVKTEDLRNIRFNTLENWFEVSNRTIRIPAMSIRSNALNLTLSGTHTFDNIIDYNIKLNAADVVLSRLKKSTGGVNSEDEGSQFGLLNVYFNLNGPIDKYKVQMSKKTVKSDFEESQLLKNKIQNRLKALNNGKEIPIVEHRLVVESGLEARGTIGSPKVTKKRAQESVQEKLEYIEGF